MSTYTVNSLADDGSGGTGGVVTLRWAIAQGDAHPSFDTYFRVTEEIMLYSISRAKRVVESLAVLGIVLVCLACCLLIFNEFNTLRGSRTGKSVRWSETESDGINWGTQDMPCRMGVATPQVNVKAGDPVVIMVAVENRSSSPCFYSSNTANTPCDCIVVETEADGSPARQLDAAIPTQIGEGNGTIESVLPHTVHRERVFMTSLFDLSKPGVRHFRFVVDIWDEKKVSHVVLSPIVEVVVAPQMKRGK
jgi:hypothetical protein